MAVLEVGSQLGGCRIEGQIGRGGMGVVYLAHQLGTDRKVALKVIAPSFSQDGVFRERFQREARLAALLQHPNVITVYDAGESGGVLYLVMEYVAGYDLRSILYHEGWLGERRAAAITAQVAAALDAAHARALVHRDVKPANILVSGATGGERVCLTDFGLTKSVRSEAQVTRSGQWVGTVDYMAPEQLDGRPVDGRADVYALGCVLYEALTGHVPFPRDSDIATIFAHLRETPPPVSAKRPDVTPAFDDVVGRALAKDPDQRFQSAGELARAAEVVAAGGLVSAVRRKPTPAAHVTGIGGNGAAGAHTIPAPQNAAAHTTVPAAPGNGAAARTTAPDTPRNAASAPTTPIPPPPRAHRRRRTVLVALAAAVIAGSLAAAAWLTGLIPHSSAADHRAATQSLSNSAANLTNQLTTVTSQLGQNPTPAQRSQIQATLANNRQGLATLRQQAAQQAGTGSPQDQQATQTLIIIIDDLEQVNGDLGFVNTNPTSPQAPGRFHHAIQLTTTVQHLASDMESNGSAAGNTAGGQPSAPSVQAATTRLNWVASACNGQCPSEAAAMAYDGVTRQLVAVALGGQGTPSSSPGLETWTWDGAAWQQQSPSTSPALTGVAGMTYDASHGDVVLLGTAASGSQTWTWDGSTWTQQQPQDSPPSVTDAAMAYDSSHQDVVLFGGAVPNGPSSAQTWTWDGTNWIQADAGGGSGPAARQGAAMADDPSLGGVLLYGGVASPSGSGAQATAYRDTWLWDGQQWQREDSGGGSGPPATGQGAGYSLTPSGASGRPLLLGASANGQWQQWRWTGSGWSSLTSTTTPHANSGAVNGAPPSLAAFDPAAGGVVVLTQGQQSQTWLGSLPAGASGTTPITAGGKIGSLTIGTSTRSDVIASAGSPALEQTGRSAGGASFDALGYDCAPGSSDPSRIAIPGNSSQQSCGTVFFIDSGSGALAAFATTSKGYKVDNGLQVGMSTADAEAASHQTALGGCIDSLSFMTPQARLTATIQGGGQPVTQPGPNGSTELVVQGGQIGAIYLTASSEHLGLFDCIDS